MMIRYLLSVPRRSLSLLIISFLLPLVAAAQEGEEGLELPEVYIYGTHLGKIQLSPKKDFSPYLAMGNLYPHSRPLSPGLHFPLHRHMPHEVAPANHFWLLVDAAGGNWWSDKVLLDCGLRNQQGFLSFRFDDFRRKNWVENHSIVDDYVRIKGVYGQDYYYLTGGASYTYTKTIKDELHPSDTISSSIIDVDLLSKLDFDMLDIALVGNISLADFENMIIVGNGDGVELKEKGFRISGNYYYDFEYFDIRGNVDAQNYGADTIGGKVSATLFSFDISTRKVLGNLILQPGARVFLDGEEMSGAPLVLLRASIPEYPVYPFVSYAEKRSINSCRMLFLKFPFVPIDFGDYHVLKERVITGGIEGEWRLVHFFAAYNHVDADDYAEASSGIRYASFRSVKKDYVEVNLGISFFDFEFSGSGKHCFHDKIVFEPTTEVRIGGEYMGFSPLRLFAGLEGSFGIQTWDIFSEIDILSVGTGFEYGLMENLFVGLKAENIFDRRYEVWPGYTEGGIQFYASLKYKILE